MQSMLRCFLLIPEPSYDGLFSTFWFGGSWGGWRRKSGADSVQEDDLLRTGKLGVQGIRIVFRRWRPVIPLAGAVPSAGLLVLKVQLLKRKIGNVNDIARVLWGQRCPRSVGQRSPGKHAGCREVAGCRGV